MRSILTLLFLFLFIGNGFSQRYTVKGKVVEAAGNESIPNATILLLALSDSAQVDGIISDFDGNFEIQDVPEGEYIFKVQYLGYQNYFRLIQATDNLDLGTIRLREEATDLNEVTVSARRATGEQRKDTTAFNASAFKTMRDASAQTLIEKLPGIANEDGVLQAQGETITQILVDGEPFFGGDVKAALQNLPAEVIESIEIFDQLSEKARLSGFDDGERIKTINIITKPNSRKGQFGRVSAGYGTDDRYIVGASINAFNEDQRITLTGLSNNINVTDYTADPNSQDNSRPQNGLIDTDLIGLNFSDKWGDKIKISGSYLYSRRENFGQEKVFREFITTDESNQFYNEVNEETRINNQHQFDMRLEYNIDERNRILFIPRFSARFEEERSQFSGETSDGTNLINTVENSRIGKNEDYDLFNRLFYSHKFKKPGRTMSFRGRMGNSSNKDRGRRIAENEYYIPDFRTEIIDQQINRNRTGISWETGVSFTEALSERSQLEIEYEIGNRINDSDQLIFDINSEDPDNLDFVLDTALSNTFDSKFLTQEVELGYQYKREKVQIQVEAQYQNAKLDNTQGFPQPFELNRVFQSFLPTFRLDYQFSENTNFEFDYDTRTNEPNLRQLQPVVDNSNPTQLYVGNPDLDQSYSNRMRIRLRSNNPETDETWSLFSEARFTRNAIVNSSFIASEPTEIQDGIILEPGSQLFQPVNVQGQFDFRSWLSYGVPVDFIKSNLRLSLSSGVNKRPTVVNGESGFNNSTRVSPGISISSNISDKVDFNFRTRFSFNNVKNTINSNLDNRFFNQRMRLNFNWIIWQGIIYRVDVSHQVNSGLSDGFDANFTLVNMSLGKKIFKNQRGEISINAFDLFRENNSIRRNVTESYIEDVQTNVLQRFFMLTFTYNIRRFSKGMDMDDYNDMINTDGQGGGGRGR